MAAVIACVGLFTAMGLFLIIRRAQAARGFSMMMGGTTPPVFMMALGIGFMLVAVATIIMYMQGMIASR